MLALVAATASVAAIASAKRPVASAHRAGASAQRGLMTGFTDSVYGEAPPLREEWLERTVRVGAQIVLLHADWASIAAVRPANPTDPSDPAYRWQELDELVRAVTAHGLRVAISVTYAPAWAEGPARPKDVPAAGVWRPDATAYGQFARAIATRYDSSFPDPERPGATLPAVRYWQAWAEPNLPDHLAPQWLRHGRAYTAESPLLYRSLLNAFYTGVKAVSATNFVVTGGTAPYGDPPGGERVAPALFVRELLCVAQAAPARAGASSPARGGRSRGASGGLRPASCPNPAHFDALAHDPYSIAGPFQHALNPDDVSIPDFAKLSAPLRLAERTGRALPRARKQLWATEFSWDSDPPDPHGVPVQEQARWLEQALYELWHEGVSVAVWYLVRDQAPVPDYASTYQSGVYLRDGTPKPAARAFEFPFVLRRVSRSAMTLWARAPAAGRLLVQRRYGSRWRTILSQPVASGAILYRRLTMRGGVMLRARLGALASLPFHER